MELVDAELLGHRAGHFGAVAGKHDRFAHACSMKPFDGLCGIFFHHVGDDDVADVISVDRNVQDRARKLAIMVIRAVCVHEFVVADQHHVLVDHGCHAVARFLAHVMDAFLIDLAGIGLLDRKRDGVVRIGFRMRRIAQQVFGVHIFFGMNRHHVEGAVGQRAGFVEHHGVHLGKRLKIVAAFDEHTKFAGTADAAEERQRHADDQGARAADHQEREAA